jgi:hypothetical protein
VRHFLRFGDKENKIDKFLSLRRNERKTIDKRECWILLSGQGGYKWVVYCILDMGLKRRPH